MGRVEVSGTHAKVGGTSKAKGKGFYCQKDCHWKRDCFKRKEDDCKEALPMIGRDQGSLAFTVADSGLHA